MAEDARKRNTDCVYFLASPLTCKKGFDCEYRHSEIARLNPRDCYYWLAGNCLNAACGFRHPPMDGPTGKVSESSQSYVPVNKTNVPCYFYFNSFCSKGETCTFLHGNDSTVATRPTKTGITSSFEVKTASANKKGPASTDADALDLHPSKKVAGPTIDVTVQCKSRRRPSAEKVSNRSACAKVSLSECEKMVVDEPVSLPPAEGSNDSRSPVHAVSDESYEEPMTDSSVEDSPRESSPGFDVVVGHGSENFDCDDDSEYILPTNREQRERNTELCRDNCEDYVAYEPMRSDLELHCEREMSYDHLEREPALFNERNTISCSRGKVIESVISKKRKVTLVNIDSEEWNHVDLRSCLHRDSVPGNHSIIGLSRRRKELSRGTSRNVKPGKRGLHDIPLIRRPALHDTPLVRTPALHDTPLVRTPALQVRKISRGPLPEKLAFSNSTSRHGSVRHSRQYRPWEHSDRYRLARRQQHPSSDMSRRPVSREPVTRDHKLNLKSIPFKGPKTLSQIKEEKKKVEETGGFSTKKRRSVGSVSSSADFRGPKLLSDILKDKRKVGGACEGNQYLAE